MGEHLLGGGGRDHTFQDDNLTCNSLGIQVHFKGSNTICTLLIAPKDKDNICQKMR